MFFLFHSVSSTWGSFGLFLSNQSASQICKKGQSEVNNQINNIIAMNILKIWKTHAWIEGLVLAHLSKST